MDLIKEKGIKNSRTLTNYIYKKFKIRNFCVICNSNSNKDKYHIHHEIYPETSKEVIEAIIQRKIYKLCKNCHNRVHKGTIVLDKEDSIYKEYIQNVVTKRKGLNSLTTTLY
jgi:hypothetical protein